jgi:adenylosuccinate synthase
MYKNTTRAKVIIGAGFGDEGKGLMTDFMAAPFGKNCVVARFNGGAQAGHTVVLPDGRRHIHSHFASGTLAGASTFLSKHFVSHPLLYFREKAELERQGFSIPTVYADRRGFVTTPYDMLINQFIEQNRGLNRHGSCGIGFGETIERNLCEKFAIRIADLANPAKLETTFEEIRQNWVPTRLKKLGLETLTNEQRKLLDSVDLQRDFVASAIRFYQEIKVADPTVLTEFASCVLEGAQGLLLDQDFGWFPHVTRSNTGLKNAAEVAEEAGIVEIETIYVTRAYATRHGAGPFPHELPNAPYTKISDPTNTPNPHQGSLRFGWLDLDLLKSSIEKDFQLHAAQTGIKLNYKLAVTCLDQLAQTVTFVKNNKKQQSSITDFLIIAAKSFGLNSLHLSHGNTRETIKETKVNELFKLFLPNFRKARKPFDTRKYTPSETEVI